MDTWHDKAHAAQERKNQLKTFGPYASGIFIEGKHGLFVVNPEDSSVAPALLQNGAYSEPELQIASELINKQSHVLVVGAHIGALAIPLAKQCKHMDVIEANPDTQRFLKTNLTLNACSNVTLHCLAASDRVEKIDFIKNRDNSGGSKRKPIKDRIDYHYDNPEIVTIDAYPLDDVLGAPEYDLIIMDIEGSEYFALKGMRNILEKAKSLAIEFLPMHLKDVAGVTGTEFSALLEPYFDWLAIPGVASLIPKASFGKALQHLYENNQSANAIYFLKHLPQTT